MTEDYYADAAAPQPSMPEQEEEPTEGESDSQTAVLPKAILAGKEFKPGEEVMLKIVQVNEDSVVVKYSEPSGEEEEPPTAPEAVPPAAGGMGPMME